MDMKEARIKKLEILIEKFGGRVHLAAAIRTTPGYIYQLLTGKRPITEKTARKYERLLSLKPGWFDEGQKEEMDLSLFHSPDESEASALLMYYLQADDRGRKTIIAAARHEAELQGENDLSKLPPARDVTIKVKKGNAAKKIK
jgi:plasmid maintenance system antidote protein VapI